MQLYELGCKLPEHKHIDKHSLLDESKRKTLHYQEMIRDMFSRLSSMVLWGSFGIIVIDSNSNSKEPPYMWDNFFPTSDERLESKVNTYVAEVKNNLNKYLVIAQLAEDIFAYKKEDTPCMIMTKEDIPSRTMIEIQKWDNKDAALHNFMSTRAPDDNIKRRWSEYCERVKDVTEYHENSICYIPIVSRRVLDNKPEIVLGAGLVLCVKNGSLKGILDVVPEAQLFLRWLFSEMFAGNEFVGLSEQLILLFDFIKKESWFDSSTLVPHDYSGVLSPNHNDIKRKLSTFIGNVSDYNENLHVTVKNLSADRGHISFATLYLIALAAFKHKLPDENIVAVNLDKKFMKQLPFRTEIGGIPYRMTLIKRFYSYVYSAAAHTATGARLIEDIIIDEGELRIILNTGDIPYVEAVSSNIKEMFREDEFKDIGHARNASRNLAHFVLWSGAIFNNSPNIRACSKETPGILSVSLFNNLPKFNEEDFKQAKDLGLFKVFNGYLMADLTVLNNLINEAGTYSFLKNLAANVISPARLGELEHIYRTDNIVEANYGSFNRAILQESFYFPKKENQAVLSIRWRCENANSDS